MARYSSASWRPLPENANQGPMKPTQVILHSAVGSGSLYNFFNGRSNLECHFWVGLKGTVEQYMSTTVEADANFKANPRAISIETADNGHPDSFEWTSEQIAAIAKILVWANLVHHIPLAKCSDWDKPGIGYHTMFGAPGHWTPVAKSCPGTIRKKQFDKVLSVAKKLKSPGPDITVISFEIDATTTNQAAVKRVQKLVDVEVDGVFGPKTEKALKAWQRKHNLTPDGVFGQKSAKTAGFIWAG